MFIGQNNAIHTNTVRERGGQRVKEGQADSEIETK